MVGQKSLDSLKGEDKIRKCPECGSSSIEFNSSGEQYCKKCGLVFD